MGTLKESYIHFHSYKVGAPISSYLSILVCFFLISFIFGGCGGGRSGTNAGGDTLTVKFVAVNEDNTAAQNIELALISSGDTVITDKTGLATIEVPKASSLIFTARSDSTASQIDLGPVSSNTAAIVVRLLVKAEEIVIEAIEEISSEFSEPAAYQEIEGPVDPVNTDQKERQDNPSQDNNKGNNDPGSESTPDITPPDTAPSPADTPDIDPPSSTPPATMSVSISVFEESSTSLSSSSADGSFVLGSSEQDLPQLLPKPGVVIRQLYQNRARSEPLLTDLEGKVTINLDWRAEEKILVFLIEGPGHRNKLIKLGTNREINFFGSVTNLLEQGTDVRLNITTTSSENRGITVERARLIANGEFFDLTAGITTDGQQYGDAVSDFEEIQASSPTNP